MQGAEPGDVLSTLCPREHERHKDAPAVEASHVVVLQDLRATAHTAATGQVPPGHEAARVDGLRLAARGGRPSSTAELTAELHQHDFLRFPQRARPRRGIFCETTVRLLLLEVALHRCDALVRGRLLTGGGVVDCGLEEDRLGVRSKDRCGDRHRHRGRNRRWW